MGNLFAKLVLGPISIAAAGAASEAGKALVLAVVRTLLGHALVLFARSCGIAAAMGQPRLSRGRHS